MNINKKWFTIVELLLGIIIFTIWLLSAYLLVYAAINTSDRSRNEITASNIAREKLELIRNFRDTNWVQYMNWNSMDIVWRPWELLTPWYYTIENIIPDSGFSISINKLSSSFSEDNSYLINPTVVGDKTRLCIESNWRYTYNCNNFTQSTRFYSYLKIEELKTQDIYWSWITVNSAYKVISIVMNSERNTSRYSIPTIITNWKK